MPFLAEMARFPWVRRMGLLASGAAGCVSFSSRALAVQWESQADRLQNISATLIDAVPVARPVRTGHFGLGVSTDVSFLPNVNTTVGAKKEKVPQAKFHLIPQFEALGGYQASKSVGFGARAYGGFLPPMPKFLSGIDAKLTQFDYGVLLDGSYAVSRGLVAFSQLGWHQMSGKVKGRIASKEGDEDTFEARTRILHFSMGLLHKRSGVYAAAMVAHKSTHSKLFIEEDDTELSLDDTLSDATIPLLSQSTLGWMTPYDVHVALSFLYVPNRLYMPRLSLGYVHTLFGGAKATPTGESGDAEAPPNAAATDAAGTSPDAATGAGATGVVPTTPSGASSPAASPTGGAVPAAVPPSAPTAHPTGGAPATPASGKGRTAPRKPRRAPGVKSPSATPAPATP